MYSICICRYVHIHREPNTFGWRSCEFYETRPPWLPPRSPGTPGSPGVVVVVVVVEGRHKTRHSQTTIDPPWNIGRPYYII
jgi:hypothetical protein